MVQLLEYEHQIYVDRNTELKKYVIQHALLDAQMTRRYAKFITGRYYISVTFNRDGTVLIATNYRSNNTFNRELTRLEAVKFTLNTMTKFIHYWINKLRKQQ